MKYLEKLIPAQDKLKHFYIGALAFVLLNSFLDTILTFFLVLFGAVVIEMRDRLKNKNVQLKEQLLDVFFSMLLGIIVILAGIILTIIRG